MIIAAGHYKETRMGAYGEAIINIITSIVFVYIWGLVGVAIGTVVATLFRQIYYVVYLSKHVLFRSVFLWIKRMIINAITFSGIVIVCNSCLSNYIMHNYIEWAKAGILVTFIAGFISFCINFLTYKKDVIEIMKRISKKA